MVVVHKPFAGRSASAVFALGYLNPMHVICQGKRLLDEESNPREEAVGHVGGESETETHKLSGLPALWEPHGFDVFHGTSLSPQSDQNHASPLRAV